MDLDLAEIDARANAATPPPWAVERTISGWMYRVIGSTTYQGGGLFLAPSITADPEAQANVEFLLHARTDIPALVAEVRRLQTMEARYRAHLARIVGRWTKADGTALSNDWSVPWAMADDAETVLAETVDHPCSTCA